MPEPIDVVAGLERMIRRARATLSPEQRCAADAITETAANLLLYGEPQRSNDLSPEWAERAWIEANQQRPAPPSWGRKFLERCGIDPDDPADVRATYESCREAHARWLATSEGEIDADAHGLLVDAIRDLYGWDRFPLDWPAPTLVLMPQPFRNLLQRGPVGAPRYPDPIPREDQDSDGARRPHGPRHGLPAQAVRPADETGHDAGQ